MIAQRMHMERFKSKNLPGTFEHLNVFIGNSAWGNHSVLESVIWVLKCIALYLQWKKQYCAYQRNSSKCKHCFACFGCEPILCLETMHAWNECRQAPNWCNNAYCSKYVREWRLKPAKHFHYSNLTTMYNASTLYFHTYILMQKLLILPVSTFLIYSFETTYSILSYSIYLNLFNL